MKNAAFTDTQLGFCCQVLQVDSFLNCATFQCCSVSKISIFSPIFNFPPLFFTVRTCLLLFYFGSEMSPSLFAPGLFIIASPTPSTHAVGIIVPYPMDTMGGSHIGFNIWARIMFALTPVANWHANTTYCTQARHVLCRHTN